METAIPATAPGLDRQPAQPADVGGYPSYGERVPAVVTDDPYRDTL
jgi:hypothetical protein